jgi:hypothetical protein
MSNKKDLLQQILATPAYSDWTEQSAGSGDYRDYANHENPPEKLDHIGLYSFKTSQLTKLDTLAKQLKLHVKPKGVDLDYIYDNATLTKHDLIVVHKYFETRGMNLSDEIIEEMGMKVNLYEGDTMLVTPMYDPAGLGIQRLYQIVLNGDYTKKTTKMLGRSDEPCGVIFGDMGSDKLVSSEGLEDAIAYHVETGDTAVLAVGGASNWKNVAAYKDMFETIVVLLDPDKDHTSMIKSAPLKNTVTRIIPNIGYDCNEAIKKDQFAEWEQSLRTVSWEETQKAAGKGRTLEDEGIAQLDEAPEKGFTDLSNAIRLVKKYGHDLRFCHGAGKWYVWDQGRWYLDYKNVIMELAKNTAMSIHAEAAEAADLDKQKATVA